MMTQISHDILEKIYTNGRKYFSLYKFGQHLSLKSHIIQDDRFDWDKDEFLMHLRHEYDLKFIVNLSINQ